MWVVFLWMCSSVHFSWLNPCAKLAPICTHCPHSWFMQVDFTLNSFWWVHPNPIPKFSHLLFLWELRSMPWGCIPLHYWELVGLFNPKYQLTNSRMHHIFFIVNPIDPNVLTQANVMSSSFIALKAIQHLHNHTKYLVLTTNHFHGCNCKCH